MNNLMNVVLPEPSSPFKKNKSPFLASLARSEAMFFNFFKSEVVLIVLYYLKRFF